MDHNVFMAALTVWREARGETSDGWRGVAHVINNRATALATKFDLKNLPETYYYRICTAPWQFSSVTAKDDPQLGLFPDEDNHVFKQMVALIENITLGTDEDITNGATHYFNPDVVLPGWASKMTKIVSIGHHDFYK